MRASQFLYQDTHSHEALLTAIVYKRCIYTTREYIINCWRVLTGRYNICLMLPAVVNALVVSRIDYCNAVLAGDTTSICGSYNEFSTPQHD